jgi:hypothetical protein
VARTLAVIMHRMWLDGSEFRCRSVVARAASLGSIATVSHETNRGFEHEFVHEEPTASLVVPSLPNFR